jgi:transcriptional regulator with XRE-family HTH domain
MQLDMFSDTPDPNRKPRLLTPQELGLLCKLQRDWRGWSQDTLAEISGLTVRTIQRVEAALPVSLDTRRALARAWSAPDIDCLNKPTIFPTMEEVEELERKGRENLATQFHVIDVAPTDGRGIVRAMRGTEALMATLADGLEAERAIEDEFARLSDYLRDLLDIADEVPATDLLAFGDEMQGMIAELARRGVTIMTGNKTLPFVATVRVEKVPVTWRVMYLFGARKGQEPKQLHVDKRMPVRFG